MEWAEAESGRFSSSLDGCRLTSTLIASVSISISSVDIACSVSHLESKVGVSCDIAATFDMGLHSGVVGLVQIFGEFNTKSDVADILGLGVAGLLFVV